ncbi:MAG: hypothetical protein NVS2B14_20830 [Chamaesiphon sp.]
MDEVAGDASVTQSFLTVLLAALIESGFAVAVKEIKGSPKNKLPKTATRLALVYVFIFISSVTKVDCNF